MYKILLFLRLKDFKYYVTLNEFYIFIILIFLITFWKPWNIKNQQVVEIC